MNFVLITNLPDVGYLFITHDVTADVHFVFTFPSRFLLFAPKLLLHEYISRESIELLLDTGYILLT